MAVEVWIVIGTLVATLALLGLGWWARDRIADVQLGQLREDLAEARSQVEELLQRERSQRDAAGLVLGARDAALRAVDTGLLSDLSGAAPPPTAGPGGEADA